MYFTNTNENNHYRFVTFVVYTGIYSFTNPFETEKYVTLYEVVTFPYLLLRYVVDPT